MLVLFVDVRVNIHVIIINVMLFLFYVIIMLVLFVNVRVNIHVIIVNVYAFIFIHVIVMFLCCGANVNVNCYLLTCFVCWNLQKIAKKENLKQVELLYQVYFWYELVKCS